MNNQMTRRSIAFGVPTLVLLSACGGGEDLAQTDGDAIATASEVPEIAVADNGTSLEAAQEAVIAPLPSDLAAFVNFYNDKYKALASSAIRNALAYATQQYSTQVNPSVPQYSASQYANPDLVDTSWAFLPSNYRELVYNKARLYVLLTDNSFQTTLYKRSDIDYYIQWILNKNVDEMNHIQQHVAQKFRLIDLFIKLTGSDQELISFNQRVTAAEAADDQRYLRGSSEDSVALDNSLGAANDTMAVTLGDRRKPVERTQLVHKASLIASFVTEPLFENETQYGKNATQVETLKNSLKYTNTSTAYSTAANQSDGIDFYVNKDIEVNGAFQNMTVEQSRQNLRRLTVLVEKETGLVYEGYYCAQHMLRGFSQAMIGLTRDDLVTKRIDLDLLQRQLVASFSATDLGTYHSSRLRLIQALGVIGGLLIASITLTLWARIASASIVNANIGKNTTAATDVNQVKARLKSKWGQSQKASSFLALGILGLSSFVEKESMGPKIRHTIGSSFALTDLLGAITDFVSVYRAGTQRTAAGVATLTGGSIRGLGGCLSAAEGVYKLAKWDSKARLYGENYPAIVMSTYTAYAAGGFYIIAGIAAAW